MDGRDVYSLIFLPDPKGTGRKIGCAYLPLKQQLFLSTEEEAAAPEDLNHPIIISCSHFAPAPYSNIYKLSIRQTRWAAHWVQRVNTKWNSISDKALQLSVWMPQMFPMVSQLWPHMCSCKPSLCLLNWNNSVSFLNFNSQFKQCKQSIISMKNENI